MSFLKMLFKANREREEKGLAAETVRGWAFGEPKPLDQKQLLDLVEANPDLRAAIEVTVNACTANGWVILGENEGEKQKVENWINANEDDFYIFLRNLIATARIFGEAYVEVYAEPVFKVLDPWTVEVKRDEYGKITGYVQKAQGRMVNFEPDEIVRIVMHPLGTRAYGSPIITSLRRVLEGALYAEMLVRDAYMRKGVLSKLFVLKSGTEADFEKLTNLVSSTRPGDSLIVKGDITIQDLGHPFRDLQVLELLREYRQKIVSVTGVPNIMLGVTEAATLETSRNQINAFAMMVKSIQRVISAGITEAIRRKLSVKSVKFRLNPWTLPEQEVRLHALKVQTGIETINEAREALGLGKLEHPIADVPLPLLQLAARGGFTEMDLEAMVSELLAQSARAFPEKSFFRKAGGVDEKLRALEKEFAGELERLFKRIAADDDEIVRLKQKYDEKVRDVIRRYMILAALEAAMYLDEMDLAPPKPGLAEEVAAKHVDTFVDDFWMIVADKKAGLIKPSKPRKNYFAKQEVGEEEIYPPQRLDYLGRIALMAATAIWGVFNRALTAIMGWARDEGEFGGKGVVRWVTAEDEKVCPMCSSLEGKTWSLDELETAAFMQPPLHPNCRCRLEVE
ncbi:MAG: phage portal protein [Nitrososphaerota archaeon]